MKVIRRKGNRFFLLILVCLIVITACNMPFLSQNTSIEKAVPGPAVAFQTPSPGSSVALNEAFPVFVVASDPLGVSRNRAVGRRCAGHVTAGAEGTNSWCKSTCTKLQPCWCAAGNTRYDRSRL